ncbi:MAG: hypothetical protein M1839_002424 [Geoglossum umbratile]|nr:MAG: hypothetical protein M1839_002424 [Geoglossum umbratile]
MKDLLKSEQRNVHLLVTSRPERDIKSEVSELAHDDDIVPLQSDLVAHDIREYVHTRVRRGNGLKRWRSQPEVQDEIETRLIKQADGIIEEAVDAITVDTEGTQYFNPRYRIPDPREITRFCSSLVVLVSPTHDSYGKTEEGSKLQLAHFSVKEYLTSERLDKDVAHNFQAVTARASIATVCLAYLLHLNRSIQVEKIKETFPLARYSARYWMDHVAMAEGKGGKLQGFIEKLFCHHRNSYWNCYSLYQPDQPWQNETAKGLENPASALYYASFGGLVNAVQYILSQGADVNAQGRGYWYHGNALQAASFGGHGRVVQLLLKEGANANAQGGRCGNALRAASLSGYGQIVQQLLEERADVNAQGGYYGNALQAVSYGGYDQIIQQLVEEGADINAQEGTLEARCRRHLTKTTSRSSSV